jgi:hypothetical protein
MNPDRSFDRAARSWLEEGPTRAPERAIEHALEVIETTPQERDLRILRRFQTMPFTARLVAAAVIGVLAVGAIYALWKPGTNVAVPGPTTTPATSPSPARASAPSPSAPTFEAYKAARDALCTPAINQVIALNEQAGKLHPERSAADRNALIQNISQIVAIGTALTDQLALLDPPAFMAPEHAADVTRHRDSLAILTFMITKLQQGKVAEANAVSDATGPLSRQSEEFEQNYGLAGCP